MSLFPDLQLTSGTDWVRQVHKTVAAFLEQQLAINGWVNAPANFGTTPVHFEEIPPEDVTNDVVPNTVSISLGDVGVQADAQLGGGLFSLPIPVFIDVYGERSQIAVSISDDIRRLLTDRSIFIYDFTDPANPVPFPSGAYIDFEQVVGPRKPVAAAEASAEFRRNWRVVRATAVSYFTAAF